MPTWGQLGDDSFSTCFTDLPMGITTLGAIGYLLATVVAEERVGVAGDEQSRRERL